MKYYKIIVNAQIIGVITSDKCFRFQDKHSTLERTVPEMTEYIECSGKLYHASWMQPIKTDLYSYTIADIIEIEEQEYNILDPISEPIPFNDDEDEDEQEKPIIEPINPVEEITIEYVRQAKINEMSSSCHHIIEGGFDLELRNEIKHFSLTTQDQLNLITLSALAQTQTLIPYHADGESCIFYTNEEINQIVETATAFKIYHTTYYNALKGYINALETIEEISAIQYGTEIPEEYKSDVLRALEQ